MPASILSQTANDVTVLCLPSLVSLTGNVVVQSVTMGTTVLKDGFRYRLVTNSITSIEPTQGPATGGNSVTILGSKLGSNDDITSTQRLLLMVTMVESVESQVKLTCGVSLVGIQW